MSTRAQIIIKDSNDCEQWFYRHSDGDPEGVTPSLNKFCEYANGGEIRGNVDQASGWLVIIGHRDMLEREERLLQNYSDEERERMRQGIQNVDGWKCGDYQPCGCRTLHPDIEFLYVVELSETWTTWREATTEEWEFRQDACLTTV